MKTRIYAAPAVKGLKYPDDIRFNFMASEFFGRVTYIHSWLWIENGGQCYRAFKFQRTKMFFPRSLVNIQYCEEPP